jgi:hypothetical protein
MPLGNMRELGVRGLAVHCLNYACRHQTVISVDDSPTMSKCHRSAYA